MTDGRQSRLSPAAGDLGDRRLPPARHPIPGGRGARVSPDGVLKTLQARGLITEASQDAGITHFVTTPLLPGSDGFGLLTELPPIADHLPDLASLDELVD